MTPTRFTFGERRGKRLSSTERARYEEAAKKHGATFIAVDVPPRYYFTAPVQGHPFDTDTIREVLGELGVQV